MIHLDTSFLIRALARGTSEDRDIRTWLTDGTELGISAVCWAEFLCGPVAAAEVELAGRLLAEPEPFVAADAIAAAKLFNASGRRRGSFEDSLIAATAMRVGAGLATANAADFRRFEKAGLRVIAAR